MVNVAVMTPGISSPTMATPRPAMAILAPPSMPLLSLNGTRGHTPRSNQIANGQREVVQSEGRTARADAGATPRAAEELHGSPLKGDHVEGRADSDGYALLLSS